MPFKYLPLIWAGLVRKPARSAFTMLSVVVAFVLFGTLQGINAGYAAVIEAQHLDRLLTDPRVLGGAPMPLAAVAKIAQITGVTRVCGRSAFFGYYQDPGNGVFALATDPVAWFSVRPEYLVPAAQLQTLKGTRDAIAMTSALRDRLKLKLGDRVPIQSRIARKDGNTVWTFELVAIFDEPEGAGQNQMALINYDYFDAARVRDIGTVDRVIVRIADPSRSAQVAASIDALFANSTHETRTQNEKEETESSIQQLGDIGFFTNAIVAAAFFALLFVTGNTMVQSVTERTGEFAVLRTLGFSSSGIFILVLAEALALCVLAAAIGLAIAAAIFPLLREVTGLVALTWVVVVTGLGTAALLGLGSSFIPAWRAGRLRIVDALAAK